MKAHITFDCIWGNFWKTWHTFFSHVIALSSKNWNLHGFVYGSNKSSKKSAVGSRIPILDRLWIIRRTPFKGCLPVVLGRWIRCKMNMFYAIPRRQWFAQVWNLIWTIFGRSSNSSPICAGNSQIQKPFWRAAWFSWCRRWESRTGKVIISLRWILLFQFAPIKNWLELCTNLTYKSQYLKFRRLIFFRIQYDLK